MEFRDAVSLSLYIYIKKKPAAEVIIEPVAICWTSDA